MINPGVDRYAAGADALVRAIDGLAPADFDVRPGPGAWSIRELVAHLLDADLVGIDRMQRIIAIDNALFMGFDENRYAERLAYGVRDPRRCAEAFRLIRLNLADTLRVLPPDVFDRTGVHSERGKASLTELLKLYCDHLDHHLAFLLQKRERLGKPLK